MAHSKGSIRSRYKHVLELIKMSKQKNILEYVFEHFTNFKKLDNFWVVNHGGYNLRIKSLQSGYSVGLYSGLSENAIQYEEIKF